MSQIKTDFENETVSNMIKSTCMPITWSSGLTNFAQKKVHFPFFADIISSWWNKIFHSLLNDKMCAWWFLVQQNCYSYQVFFNVSIFTLMFSLLRREIFSMRKFSSSLKVAISVTFSLAQYFVNRKFSKLLVNFTGLIDERTVIYFNSLGKVSLHTLHQNPTKITI